ncbi:hypothetical protein LC085_02910 [Bacillus tianshenii]|uniref:hypothetical protein n=1 Tax=Sutcliffiella tianshenii TaxID=1463404 RepID=UPI001CD39A22|nr:hypothetical protein [Bacillus tianshenii]MCA1318847.1 hypothetical protein [Bacillus tianshenii]
MKRLLLCSCTFILLSACSTESNTTEEIVVVNQPNPSIQPNDQSTNESSLYIKDHKENDDKKEEKDDDEE